MELVHLSACAFMTGLIWLVQIVHYPGFVYVDVKGWSEFHRFHSARISWIVLPVMVTELVTGFFLFFQFSGWIYNANFLAILLTWATTFFVSVPLHNRLSQRRDEDIVRKLVLTNWLRTSLWTTRLFLLAYFTGVHSQQ
jgi:hypothetical protein